MTRKIYFIALIGLCVFAAGPSLAKNVNTPENSAVVLAYVEQAFDDVKTIEEKAQIVSKALHKDMFENPQAVKDRLIAALNTREDDIGEFDFVSSFTTNAVALAIHIGDLVRLKKFLSVVDFCDTPDRSRPLFKMYMVITDSEDTTSKNVSLEKKFRIMDFLASKGFDFNKRLCWFNSVLLIKEEQGKKLQYFKGYDAEVVAYSFLLGRKPGFGYHNTSATGLEYTKHFLDYLKDKVKKNEPVNIHPETLAKIPEWAARYDMNLADLQVKEMTKKERIEAELKKVNDEILVLIEKKKSLEAELGESATAEVVESRD